jgi:5-methylcytosine-specific restriction endonuclease McrA
LKTTKYYCYECKNGHGVCKYPCEYVDPVGELGSADHIKCDIGDAKWVREKCALCGKQFTDDMLPTKDHMIPLFNIWCHGLTFGNVQALCNSCNSSKGEKFSFAKGMNEILVNNI